jgi:hypothetical protein
VALVCGICRAEHPGYCCYAEQNFSSPKKGVQMLKKSMIALTMAFAAVVAAASPAQAGAYGDVQNHLASGTVKVARFLSDGASRCGVWNSGGGANGPSVTWNCNVRTLNRGAHSDEAFGWFYDADGFMLERDYEVQWGAHGTVYHRPAGNWTKISSIETAICEGGNSGKPRCRVELF